MWSNIVRVRMSWSFAGFFTVQSVAQLTKQKLKLNLSGKDPLLKSSSLIRQSMLELSDSVQE